MKRRVMIATTVVLTILCCLSLVIYWDGYYLPNNPCRLVTYPDARRTTSNFTYSGNEPVEMLLQFYDRELNAQPVRTEYGQWVKEKLTASATYLYSCYSNDINGITTETGCIYISSNGKTPSVKTEFFRSEGGHIPCAR